MGIKKQRTLQKDRNHYRDIFDIPYYNKLRSYLSVSGLNPYISNDINRIIVLVIILTNMAILTPTLFALYVSYREKDWESMIECIPHLVAISICTAKVLNVYINRKSFKKLFDFVTQIWKELTVSKDIEALEKITAKGSKIAQLYRSTFMTFTVIFLFGPLLIPLMDIVIPLNETRPRQQAIKVDYLIFDAEKYFYYVYIHVFYSAIVVIFLVITIDSMYITIIHHTSGLFAVCGCQVKRIAQNTHLSDGETSEASAMEQFKNCAIMHNKAIQFYEILRDCSSKCYFFQVGLNMISISATAFQTVLNLDKPEEAIRSAVFLGGEQFHLFVISLPGQVLLDHSNEFRDNVYSSNWYDIPVKIQKMLCTMQLRSSKPCALTAGGLYDMNMENFGTTFKTCMSYFTMLMSMRE